MREAITLAVENVRAGCGGPFAALIVRENEVVARGTNLVTSTNDPTAHAEIVAIRRACEALGTFQLIGCDVYTTCEPCPMCLGAIYWARPDRIYYASTREDAALAGFDDSLIYEEVCAPVASRRIAMHNLMREEGAESFAAWRDCQRRIDY
jgi:tRNA(Arg) A34 adenosine deaminase TadA